MISNILLIIVISVLFWAHGWKKGLFFMSVILAYSAIEILLPTEASKNISLLILIIGMFTFWKIAFGFGEKSKK